MFTHLKDLDILQAAASILRNELTIINKSKLPDSLNSKRLIEGECLVPPTVSNFIASVIGGYRRQRRSCNNFERHVNSLSEDMVYIVHNGNIKTPKHICLGMALKSLTSSRKVIDIINRYGHCISYSAVEELETEATFTSTLRTGLCPEAINKTQDLSAGVAYDNYDRFVETTTGKDTLHDTVGIIYQNINLDNLEDDEGLPKTFTNRRRRRTFQSIDKELPFYAKKPR